MHKSTCILWKSIFFWSQLMVVGVIGASGAIVQRMSMAYKWGPDNAWIQSLHLVENCALVPMQQLWGDAQIYPAAVKVFEKFERKILFIILPLRAFSWWMPFTAYLQQNFWPRCCLLACSPSVIGAHIEVSTQHARRVGNENCSELL